MSRKSRGITPGGDRRSVTVTFGYGEHLRSVVAHNLRTALAQAKRRWGQWETVESISTPDTIYADLIGATKAQNQPGIKGQPGIRTTRSKLAQAGYHAAPGETGSLRRFRDELPILKLARCGRKRHG